ncbi:SH3 domain-containing protein [Aquimarina sp. 2201CG14-23]|uniref:SH3 domain-containing protein n=1 Tax=Aquimarina mycalae TaxID=3040073 RepID=UPI002477D942|nr:SH3 domain-containing protein [Aquimarina sp. 2201CG14-23]MDH7444723.1 SH3 domain-containing protein [Aquimarina sp. 2201CG14-23]
MKSIFTFILLLVMASGTSFAQIESLDRYLTSTAKLELRTGPGANFDIIGEIPQGTQVYVISSGYGEWSTVQYKNGNGFVLTNLLAEDSSIAEAERIAKAAEARKNAARIAAEQAIKAAEEAKIAAAEAARKAIADAEKAQRAAEAAAAAAAAEADAANQSKSAAERRRLAELAETQRAVEEASKRTLGNTRTASTPIESKTASNGSNSNRAAAAPSKVTREDKFANWEKKTYKSGATPKSFSKFKGKFEYKLDNYLKIEVGKNTDVVVKLIKMGKTEKDDETVRIVFINSNQTQYIRNIPEGEYYCVIAYGKEWKETEAKNGRRQGTFTKNALYEKDGAVLNYNTIKTEQGINVPSYSLSLDLLPNGTLEYGNNTSDEDKITPGDFNAF